MNYDLLRKAREILQPLWDKAFLKGTCWGPKSEANHYSGTNIVFAIGDELVAVSKRGDALIVHEFRKTESTKLGKEIKKILQELQAKPLVLNEKEVIPLSGFIWHCPFCRKNGVVKPGILEEVDSRGEGSRVVVRRVYRDHQKASPECDAPYIEILDKNLVKNLQLTELFTSQRVR